MICNSFQAISICICNQFERRVWGCGVTSRLQSFLTHKLAVLKLTLVSFAFLYSSSSRMCLFVILPKEAGSELLSSSHSFVIPFSSQHGPMIKTGLSLLPLTGSPNMWGPTFAARETLFLIFLTKFQMLDGSGCPRAARTTGSLS